MDKHLDARPIPEGDDARYIAALTASVLECENTSEVSDCVLRPTCDLLNANSAVYLEIVRNGDNEVHFVDGHLYNVAHESLAAYIGGYFRDDPVLSPDLKAQASSSARTVMRSDGLNIRHLRSQVEARDFERTDYYRGFLMAFGIGDVLGVTSQFDAVGSHLHVIGLHRRPDQPRFGWEEHIRLKQVAPILRMGLQNLSLRQAVSVQQELIDGLSEYGGGIGYVAFDDLGQILQGNAAGLQALGGPGGNARLACLQQRIADNTPRLGNAERFEFAFDDDAGRRVRLRLTPSGHRRQGYICAATFAASTTEERMAAIMARDGMTGREAAVARLLAAGMSNDVIAGDLGISVRTVENHLRAIYAKAGVHSRTALMARLFDG